MWWIIAVVLSLILTVLSQGLTIPLSPMRLTHQQTHAYHHLRHLTSENGAETYPLHSLKSLFVLHLNVNGFNYNLSIDTGSSDLFIKGQDMEGNPEKKFSCPKCKIENQYVSISYLDGQLDTYLQNSTIILGNHTFNQRILVAYASDNIIQFKKIGGIVGLSFQEIARNPYPNFISTLIKQKIIEKYRFGLKLNFVQPQSSYITFGGIDTKYIDPAWNVTYYDIMEGSFSYQLKSQHLKFGNKQLDIKTVLLDSGNTCVSLDEKYTNDMLQQLNKGGNKCEFTVERGTPLFKLLICIVKDFDSLPVLNLIMPDNKKYSWQKEYYIDQCKVIPSTQSTPTYNCTTLIQSTSSGHEQLFLGAAWMLKYYGVFDLDNKQIGMAKNIDNPKLNQILQAAKKDYLQQIEKQQKKSEDSTDSQQRKSSTS